MSFVRDFVENNLIVKEINGKEFGCLCPYHNNVGSPSFYINTKTGLFFCHNPICGKKGRFPELYKHVTGREMAGALVPDENELKQSLDIFAEEEVDDSDEYEDAIDRISINYRDSQQVAKLNYLLNRGFDQNALEHFDIGFSVKQNRIVIPVRNEHHKAVGFIGRAIGDDTLPKYKYSDKFPRRNILLNLNNAKQYDSVIVVEGSLDHIKVHQAGFPNVVSTMGSTFTQNQVDLLNKYFSKIIIFADNDDAGHKMKCGIMESCPQKDIWVVQYSGDAKDPGDMTEPEIKQTINNRITHLEWLFNEL